MNETLYAKMEPAKTWSPTQEIAWLRQSDGRGNVSEPVLSQAWRCQETGEVDWRPVQTLVYRTAPSTERAEVSNDPS